AISAAASSNGKSIVTLGEDKAVRIWEVTNPGPIQSIPLHAQGEEFVPLISHDGRTVLTAVKGGPAQLWDTQTGGPIGGPLNHSTVSSAVFSTDSKSVAIGDWQGIVRHWDATTGTQIGQDMRTPGPGAKIPWYIAFSGDGRTILTSSRG